MYGNQTSSFGSRYQQEDQKQKHELLNLLKSPNNGDKTSQFGPRHQQENQKQNQSDLLRGLLNSRKEKGQSESQQTPRGFKERLISSYIEERKVIVDQISQSDYLNEEIMKMLLNRLDKLDDVLPALIEKYGN